MVNAILQQQELNYAQMQLYSQILNFSQLSWLPHATSVGASPPPRLILVFFEGEGTSSKFMATSISFTLVIGTMLVASVSTSAIISDFSGSSPSGTWTLFSLGSSGLGAGCNSHSRRISRASI